MSSGKIVELDELEIAALVRGCDHAREIIAAVLPALAKVDIRLRAARMYLDELETKTRYAEEVSDNENGVFIE